MEREERTVTGVDTSDIPLGLLVKLGSIARHADELLSPGGHPMDGEAIRSLLADAEVSEWLAHMDSMALLPVKRDV